MEASPPPLAPVLERTACDFDDTGTQEGGFAWRFMTYEARGEGARVIFLASRATGDHPRIDDLRAAVFPLDVRADAPDTPGRVLREIDSGLPVAFRRSVRLMLAEETAQYTDETRVVPWEERPLGADAWGLSIAIEHRGGSRLAWRLANAREVPVDLVLDDDPSAIDRGCLSLAAVGPDGHLVPPRPREGRLPAPRLRTLPPGGAAEGEIDLLNERDLPDGVARVVLVYSGFPAAERLAAYAEGTAWPGAWRGALASNELVLRVTRE